jgi:hypothetical protein
MQPLGIRLQQTPQVDAPIHHPPMLIALPARAEVDSIGYLGPHTVYYDGLC